MRRQILLPALIAPLLVVLALTTSQVQATGEINILTDLDTPFPPGCVAMDLPTEPASIDNTLVDAVVEAPAVGLAGLSADVEILVWRVGCHDEGFSVVLVRLRQLTGANPVLVPLVFAEAGNVFLPNHQAHLHRLPASGPVGASGDFIGFEGTTYLLAVDQLPLSGPGEFLVEDYNDFFSLEFFWAAYAPLDAGEGELFLIDGYIPALDPPQDPFPVFHGRMSGQYEVPGLPFTGMNLLVGELIDGRNYLFAIFYTHLDGLPFWVAGNTSPRAPGFDIVTLNMAYLTGGEFFTDPPGSFTAADMSVVPIGPLIMEVLDCHTLLVGYDFSSAGFGSGVIEMVRVPDGLGRVAGYDCNPWVD